MSSLVQGNGIPWYSNNYIMVFHEKHELYSAIER